MWFNKLNLQLSSRQAPPTLGDEAVSTGDRVCDGREDQDGQRELAGGEDERDQRVGDGLDHNGIIALTGLALTSGTSRMSSPVNMLRRL